MVEPPSQIAAAKDRVSWPQLIAYGTGGLIPVALFNAAGQLVQLLGNISLGLDAFMLGAILLVPKLWDAIADPIIGHFSDNTRSRWGRRRPYLLLGGILVGLTFIAMWWVPRGNWFSATFSVDRAQAFHLASILGVLLLFYTAISLFEIPHGALGMEMSDDYHERTRLFSAKSFFGNVFAMGTPWMIALAETEFFGGSGGDPIDGMHYISTFVAILLIPMAVWWFVTLKEPGFAIAKEQQKSTFWHDMRKTVSNRSFLMLVGIIFTLAMGFNFVNIFNQYITIFYIYGGELGAAGKLLGWNGTVWGVTGLLAVFPLNWLSKRLGKNATLLIAILLMCSAQLSKIVCYNPDYPYLLLIPTILLSSGMLMFFTLGASMVGDVTDEDELITGTRSEGSFYSVYWWFIQMGTAFASFVMGALLVFTAFDQQQNVYVEAMQGSIERIKAKADAATSRQIPEVELGSDFNTNLERAIENSDKLRSHLADRVTRFPDQRSHLDQLIERNASVRAETERLRSTSQGEGVQAENIGTAAAELLLQMPFLKQQSPNTLFRLRVLEIGVPLALSVISIVLTLRYPLTEARCYEIKAALQQRHEARQAESLGVS